VERVTTAILTAIRTPRATPSRRFVAAITFIVLGLADILGFGMFAHKGDAIFALSLSGSGVQIPSIHAAAAITCFVCGAISLCMGGLRFLSDLQLGAGTDATAAGGAATWLRSATDLSRTGKRVSMAVALLCALISLVCWTGAGSSTPLNVVGLLQGALQASIPLILGAMSGLLCERSGVINIAIEGQLLSGAFTAAIVASAFGGLWVGLVAGSLAGGLIAILLGVFAITFLVDQIVLGVVLNVLALGLTDYLYDRLMATNPAYNTGISFSAIKIPGLGSLPIIGPIFFDGPVFLYITYVLILVIQIALFRSRWGLRVRAVGEHPTAADTLGIKVLWIRYRNVLLGGLVAGIGGAYLTIGSVGSFNPDISSGLGYIALAAMIFGRWTPLGSLGAALLFGFFENFAYVLSTENVPIPSQFLLMAPYLVTIIAVAGLVGKVRAPAADGKPYVKA
jgi:general nucleoside transport system permease protein